ncbi:MAG TPA: tubulin-like doman-containing protein, partial [Gemmataceae bacterium]|nr:tubulin-like doman-containing protein [Gemmataceae bacterium]
MPLQTQPGAEIIPGYRLEQRLGTGGFGEVWRTTAPGGLTKALKIVFGHMDESRAAQELKALDRVKSVRHPFLLSLERVEIVDNQLLIVTELAERSLVERFQECRAGGLPGIPRDELLAYMRDAAEALDYMNENFGLQHLDIKPQNLLLVAGRIKIADFGLVKELRGGSGTITGGVTPFYATPEAFDGRVSRYSDQYSLAIVYQEMLTGLRPFPGTSTLQLALQHSNSAPDLEPLPVSDRPTIGRALAKIPGQRFPTCRDMVASLQAPAGFAAAPPPVEEKPAEANPPVPRKNASGVKVRKLRPSVEAAPGATRDVGQPRPDPPAALPALLRQMDSRPLDRLGSLPLTKPAADTGLRPTLLVGIGGIAGWTLRKLRQKLYRRFGDLSVVPALRLLLIDTDRVALQQARQGEIGEALEASETLLLPLQRPQHYRGASLELLKWLERRWLYNIPRSLLTEGLRPLGRLALIDNLSEVFERVRQTLAAMTSGEARAATAEASGMDLRSDLPQIIVLASIAGGTGSGAVLDFAYAVRQVLHEWKMARASVCGILVHATNQRPTEEDLARLNAFVTLNELQHYSQPSCQFPGDAFHGLKTFGPNVPPFDDCYVVHLGEQIAAAEVDARTNKLAEYLFVNMATSVGAYLERWRRGSGSLAVNPDDRPPLRLFALQRYGSPRRRLALLAAGCLCTHIVERWQGENLGCSEESMRQEIAAKSAALGLEAQAVENAFCAAALQTLGEDAEKYFVEHIAGLPSAPPGKAATSLSLEVITESLARIESYFSGGGAVHGAAASALSLDAALSRKHKELLGNLGPKAIEWLIALVENPSRRVLGAVHASNALRQQIHAGAAGIKQQLEQVRDYQATLRKRLLCEEQSDTDSAMHWLGGLRARQSLSGSYQQLAEYFLFRLKEQTMLKTAAVLEAAATQITDWTRELDSVHDKLRNLGQSFVPAYSMLDLPAAGTTPSDQ